MLRVERDLNAIKCECGGLAERVPCTEEELKEYNCGRSWECCCRAFVCVICKKRTNARADSPEMG